MDIAKITNVRIIQPVTVSNRSQKMSKSIILLLTIFISSFMSLCFIFLMDFLDKSLNSPNDVEKLLGLSVLGSLREKKETLLGDSNKEGRYTTL